MKLETVVNMAKAQGPFSILERIDVGETTLSDLSPVSNLFAFQYPRTDRRG